MVLITKTKSVAPNTNMNMNQKSGGNNNEKILDNKGHGIRKLT